MLEWMLLATGFTGALTLVFLFRAVVRRLTTPPFLRPHFSPKGGCMGAIVHELSLAHREILVQAYSFSCPNIANALAAARARGVAVHVLLDRANVNETYSELGALEQRGLQVLIDARHAIAHNKIIIIDRKTLLTGSFNFTRQAELENAENLLIIKGHHDLVQEYVRNFMSHYEHSQAPSAAAPHKSENAETPRHAQDASHRRVA
jgi:phosphatidylserine/phosphatidylglycerophosphate/cardiolipin synthase-like enzyme